MSRISIHGYGVVSPAGWGMVPFREVIDGPRTLAPGMMERPDGSRLPTLRVPAPAVRPAWLAHARLRRSSLISHYGVAAAMEALGAGCPPVDGGLGIVSCVMGGSVQYSRRYFGEVLKDPSTASPLLFPETVFNAPASHLAAMLGTPCRNDTCVADESGFLAGLVIAADWLSRGVVGECLVVAAEEADWTTAEASRLFSRSAVSSEGAAAVRLRRGPGPVELIRVTSPQPYRHGCNRTAAVEAAIRQLGGGIGTVRFSHGIGPRIDGGRSMNASFGDGLAASGGWACVAAMDALLRGESTEATVCVAGSNLQVMGAVFRKGQSEP